MEVSVLEGDWPSARAYSDRHLLLGAGRMIGRRAFLEYVVGDFAQGELYLDRMTESFAPEAINTAHALEAAMIPWVARITGVTGRLQVARGAAEAVLSSPGVLPNYAWLARTGLAQIAVQEGDAATAGEQYEALISTRGTLLTMTLMCSDRLLGLLAHTMGNLDDSAVHFEDALDFCRKAGYRPELAWTCCDYADMLRERDGAGDQEKATALLDESLAISRELGMRPLMERVLSRREILGA